MAGNSQNASLGKRQDFDPALLSSFKGLTLEHLDDQPAPQWLIERWLPEDVLALLYAAPDTGKTFLGLDWTLSIATGTPWLGHTTRPCKVLYVYGERFSGLRQRLEAWFAEHGEKLRPPAERNFRVVKKPVNLRDPRERAHFIRAHCEFQPQLIVIDTLNRCFGADGNESQTQDMTEFVAGCEELRAWFPGATVLILHHSGKNEERGARGSNVLLAAITAEFHLVEKGSAGKLTLTNTKQNDGAPPEPLALQRAVLAGSCVIRLAGGAAAAGAKPAKARPEDKALAILAGLGPEGATEKEWRDATGSHRNTFDRHRNALLKAERVTRGEDGRFRVVEAARPEAATPPTPSVIPSPASRLRARWPVPEGEEEKTEEAVAGLLLWGKRGATTKEWHTFANMWDIASATERTDLVRCNPEGRWCATEAAREAHWERAKDLMLEDMQAGATLDEWLEDCGLKDSNACADTVWALINEMLEEGRIINRDERLYRPTQRAAA